jgi:hypothetical protein
MPKPKRTDERVRRTLLLSAEVDKALGLAAVETKTERGDLAEIALRLYLPTISDLDPVKGISVGAEKRSGKAA